MNSLFVIFARKIHDTWVFDDAQRELTEEPFVLGTSEAIDFVLNNKDVNECKITHSRHPFPGWDVKCMRMHKDLEGYWYCLATADDMEVDVDYFWLCPATEAFYGFHPETIYVKIDSMF